MPREKFRTARRKNKANIPPNNQPSRKRKLWTDFQMTSALEEYKKGKMTIGKIVKKFNVPKTTLHNCISSQVQHGTKPGQNPYLQADKEEALVEHSISPAKKATGKLESK